MNILFIDELSVGDFMHWKRSYFLLAIFLSLLLLLITKSVFSNDSFHSSSLHIVKSTEGEFERIDYINDDGMITYATDKHYATLIKTHSNQSLLEEYFDASGKPALQSKGYYALLREYNEQGQNVKITYLGRNKKPVMIKSGYATIVKSYNATGYVETEMYYDTDGEPVKSRNKVFGCLKEYNEIGRNVRLTYLDQNHNPIMSGQGFAIICKSYYETGELAGKVKDEYYFDETGLPINLSLGQYGIHKEYDQFGRENLITYLDIHGNPTVNIIGYSTLSRTYNEDDSVNTELYYDTKGNPVALSDGQYGCRFVNGSTIFLDSDGKDLFNLKNYLYSHQISVILICMSIVLLSLEINKYLNIGLLFIYCFFIIYMTLLHREGGKYEYNFSLLWSYKQFFVNYELRWEILNNIILFIPLGSILYKIIPHITSLLIVAAISLSIETIQLITGTGLCEFDDLISNVIGGVFGFSFAYLISFFVKQHYQHNSIV